MTKLEIADELDDILEVMMSGRVDHSLTAVNELLKKLNNETNRTNKVRKYEQSA